MVNLLYHLKVIKCIDWLEKNMHDNDDQTQLFFLSPLRTNLGGLGAKELPVLHDWNIWIPFKLPTCLEISESRKLTAKRIISGYHLNHHQHTFIK